MRYPLNYARPVDPLGAGYQTAEGQPEFWDVQNIAFKENIIRTGAHWLPARYAGWLPGQVDINISYTAPGVHGDNEAFNIDDKPVTYNASGSFEPDTGFLDNNGFLADHWSDPNDFVPVILGDRKSPYSFILVGNREDYLLHLASSRPGPDGPIVTPARWEPLSPKWCCVAYPAQPWPSMGINVGGVGKGFPWPDDPRGTDIGQGNINGVSNFVYDFNRGGWACPDPLPDGQWRTVPLPDGSGSNGLRITITGTPVYCW